MKDPVRAAVTGAAGQISCALLRRRIQPEDAFAETRPNNLGRAAPRPNRLKHPHLLPVRRVDCAPPDARFGMRRAL